MKNKLLIIIGGILLFFVITNPSITAFKNYRGKSSYYDLKRPLNLFVFSEYEDHGKDYLGILGNFLWINKPKPVEEKNYLTGDSARMDDSVKIDCVRINDTLLPPPPRKKAYTQKYDEYGIPIRRKSKWNPPTKDSLVKDPLHILN